MTDVVLRAKNTAPDSPNRIHTEEARQYGFKGGIVPGLTLYAYLVRPLVEHYGPSWLESGQMETRFRRPVYDGDEITLSVVPVDDDGDSVSLTVRNADGVECVTGSAMRFRDRPAPDPDSYPNLPFDDSPIQDGTPELLGTLPDLMEWEMDTTSETVREFLDQIDEHDPVFDTILHPATITRVSTVIVGRRFNFGPRIHANIRSRFLATAPIDAQLTGRGRIARVWERNGNHYLESDLLVVDSDNRPIMQIDSESLFQLGASRTNG